MKRAIVTPAALSASALSELKQWLRITTAHDDAPLTALLRTAIDMCEAFTGTMPLEVVAEEVLPAGNGWCALSTRPVQAITGIEGITASGDRFAIAGTAYEFELDADGTGMVRLLQTGAAAHMAVQFIAGLSPDWDSLPDAMRQGIMRLAAHQHRERDNDGAGPMPPASIAALWRPWRRMRLS